MCTFVIETMCLGVVCTFGCFCSKLRGFTVNCAFFVVNPVFIVYLRVRVRVSLCHLWIILCIMCSNLSNAIENQG